MIPAERESRIVETLKTSGVVTVEELSQSLNVSQMTIRRDLDKLEKKGLAYRSHGGAMLKNHLEKEQLYDTKKQQNNDIKKQIAQAALHMIKSGDTILLDAGTTTFELALLLKQMRDLTVVTTDLKIALELYDSDIRVFVAGGQIQKETSSVMGSTAVDFISELYFDIAFIGTSSISKDWALCTPTMEKADLKRKIIQSASHSVLLTDSSKFYKESFIKICTFEQIGTVITDKQFTKEESLNLEKINVEIINI